MTAAPVQASGMDDAVRQASRIRHLQIVLILVAGACLALSATLLNRSGKPVRTVLVPASLGAKAWIEDERMSPGFHIEWASHLAALALSATPASAEHQAQMLLRHVSPAVGERFAAELDVNIERLRTMQASTFFSVTQAHARAEAGQAALVGFLSTFIRDRLVSERPRAYVLEFQVNNGRPLLTAFQQTTSRDPFGDNASKSPFADGGAR